MKKYKIKKGFEFRRVLRKGRWTTKEHITLYVIENKFKFNRFGVCVAKKNGNSVRRNKLKRWAREAFKNALKEINIKNSYDIVLMYKKETTVNKTSYLKVFTQVKESLNDVIK